MTDPTFWIVARVTGLVAFGLMTATMLAGLLLAGRARPSWARPADIVDLHKTLSLGALVMTGAHGIALVMDHAVDIPLTALLVPGMVPYRPLWTSLGVLAAWLALSVHVSFSLRKRIGAKVWRKLHYGTYGAFALATAHGLASGTDSGKPWVLAMYGGAVGAVTAATVWRAGVEKKSARAKRTAPRAAATVQEPA